MSEYLFKEILLFINTIRTRMCFSSKMFDSHEKEDNIMTNTQVEYAKGLETKRHDLLMEEENRRHDLATEYQARLDYDEKVRANKAAEANSRYAADQALAGNVAKAQATEYSARANERSARMKVVADAAQKNADRELTKEQNALSRTLQADIAQMNNDVQKEANSIKQQLADQDKVRNEEQFEVWRQSIEKMQSEIEAAKEQMLHQQRQDDLAKDRLKLDKRNSDWEHAYKNADQAITVVDNLLKRGNEYLNTISNFANSKSAAADRALNTYLRELEVFNNLRRNN